MGLLSDPTTPRRVSEMSLDVKLFFAYHITMMLMFGFGRAVPVETQLAFTAMLAASLAVVSIVHRRASGWRWPGAGFLQVAGALMSAALVGVFLFAATPLFSPSNPAVLPWYLAGLGIGLFQILSALRVVRVSKADFEADCRGASAPHAGSAETGMAAETDPKPQRWVRVVFTVLFTPVWLSGVAFFYLSGTSMRDGSTVQTATHSVRLSEHGHTVYITPAQDQLLHTLQTVFEVGVPLTVASAFALHFLFGVRLFGTRR